MSFIVIENHSRDEKRPSYEVMGIYETKKLARKAIAANAKKCLADKDELTLEPDLEWGSDCIIAEIVQTVRPAPFAKEVAIFLDERD